MFNAMEEKSNIGVMQNWKQFNIADCIVTVKEALKDLKQDSVNACWKKLWPEAVKNFTKIHSACHEIQEIVNLAHCIKGRDCLTWYLGRQKISYKSLIMS
jgi:uncharacterized protein YjlB